MTGLKHKQVPRREKEKEIERENMNVLWKEDPDK